MVGKKKGPKTSTGQFRKTMTGDGRKKLSTAIDESLGLKKKKGKKGKKKGSSLF